VSRQGFYRLPLATIDAVRDGALTLFEWSILTWLAANADYKTGLVRTSAPHLADELAASVASIRKCLRKLRANDWIFYSTAKRGLYPIGIYGFLIGEHGRTATANEWRLKYGKSFRLISEGSAQINLWINLWISLNNEFSGGQLSLREPEDQSRGQSAVAAKARRLKADNGNVPPPPGQSHGQSHGQSDIPPTLENPHVEVDYRSDPTHTEDRGGSAGELVGEVSSSTNNLDKKIWTLYERKYQKRTKSGIRPSHSRKDAEKSIREIRYVLDDLRGDGTSDEQYLRLLADAFDLYFRQRDPFVSSETVKWNLSTFVARLPGILEEIEQRKA
jgi:hypothetical protein